MNEPDKRVWLVTGGAGALGSALGLELSRRGDEVILLDRDRRGLETIHDRIETECGQPPALYPMDLSGASANDYETLLETLSETWSKLDGIIHAAAEVPGFRPLEHTTPPEWFGVLQCALTGPYLLTRAVFPLLRQAPDARVVWVVDDETESRKAFWGAYGVGQAARRALVDIWQAEMGHRGPRIEAWQPEAFRSPVRAAGRPAEDPGSLPDPEVAARALLDWLESA